LKVQIPNEDEEDESPQATAAATRTPMGRDHPVLPPPSPSASALLSAGASGPPNPFARPPPPNVNGFNGSRNDIETPISALPSRFVSDQLLPSPSSFYADWSNMLPSPLAFPTPVVGKGHNFGEEEERKRKLEESSNTPEKRLKI
jgi:MADS-box transcription factor